MIDVVKVFLGFDEREALAYHVCSQSLIDNSRRPLAIYPLALSLFRREYKELHADGSNAFVYTRFLIPWLCGFKGRAIYMDSDTLVRGDIGELWDSTPRMYRGVSVVKHDYRTKHPVKYLGAKNEDYPRKNWSSVMLWECGYSPNKVLTPGFVSKQSGEFLHRFQWLADDQIGELDPKWNRLVSEQPVSDGDRLLHFTVGTPCFDGYEDQDGADEWRETRDRALKPMRL